MLIRPWRLHPARLLVINGEMKSKHPLFLEGTVKSHLNTLRVCVRLHIGSMHEICVRWWGFTLLSPSVICAVVLGVCWCYPWSVRRRVMTFLSKHARHQETEAVRYVTAVPLSICSAECATSAPPISVVSDMTLQCWFNSIIWFCNQGTWSFIGNLEMEVWKVLHAAQITEHIYSYLNAKIHKRGVDRTSWWCFTSHPRAFFSSNQLEGSCRV